MSKAIEEKDFAGILKEKNLRVTFPRMEILRVLKSSSKPVTVFEIHSKVSEQGFDLATVYRTINSFLDKRLVTDIDFKDDYKRYELIIDRHHHHHIVCRKCGKVENIDICLTDKMEQEVEKKGYRDITHSLEFFGVCEICSSDKKQKEN